MSETSELVANMERGIRALALEVPGQVYDDIMVRWRGIAEYLNKINDHLPKCLRCKGKGYLDEMVDGAYFCPDCTENRGKASIQRCLAIAGGVINDVDEHGTGTWQSVREYLVESELKPW